MKTSMCVGCLLLISALANTSANSAEWGDLAMTFTYDGAVPTPAPANVNKDVEFCGKHKIVDESLLVNSSNKGIANVVVWLYVERGGKKPPVHEDYAKSAGDVNFDNKNCRFEPHICPVQVGQQLIVGNSDPIGHNTNIASSANPPSNVLVPAGGSLKQKFSTEERLPTPVSCNIHPWMKAYLVVKDSPYVGVSDADGKLVIKNVPAGKWTFQVWQEKAGYVRDVTQGGKKTSWNRGRVELTVKSGMNDLGEIKLPPDLFK